MRSASQDRSQCRARFSMGPGRELILRESAAGAKPHLARYLEEWERLRAATGER